MLEVETPDGSRWVMMAGGAPLDTDDIPAIRAALDGSPFDFQVMEVEGTGEYAGMGRLLWRTSLPMVEVSAIAAHFDDQVHRTGLSDAISSLPISPATCRVVGALDPSLSLGTLLRTLGVRPEQVAKEILALVHLRMLSFQSAQNAHEVRARHVADRPAELRMKPQAEPTIAEVRKTAVVSEPAPRRPDPCAPRPAGAEAARPQPTPSILPSQGRQRATGVQDSASSWPGLRTSPSSDRSGASPRSLLRGKLEPPAGSAAKGPSWFNPIEAAPRPVAVARQQLEAPSPASGDPGSMTLIEIALFKRLRRESRMALASDPWTILGIPHSSHLNVVREAGARMKGRYQKLAHHRNADIRRMAETIVAQIEDAVAHIDAEHPAAPVVGIGDPVFREGVSEAEKGHWSQADRYLSIAHQKHLDSPEILTWLGWVRYNNPQRPEADRQKEGMELLALAIQFRPDYADGLYYMARVLFDRGEDQTAERYVKRAQRIAPEHEGVHLLLRRMGLHSKTS